MTCSPKKVNRTSLKKTYQETSRATSHQSLNTPVRKGLPKIDETEEWGQECNSEPVAYRKTHMPGASLGRYYHKTGIITSNITQHSSEHSVGRESQINYNI